MGQKWRVKEDEREFGKKSEMPFVGISEYKNK